MKTSASIRRAPAAAFTGPGRSAYYRMNRIHFAIKSGRYPNVPELARTLEVSRRTVERDLSYMRDLFNAPFEYDRRRRGYFYTEPGYTMPQTELSEGEVAALMVAARMLAQGYDTPTAIVAERALKRIISLLPGKILFNPQDFETAISFGPAGAVVIDDTFRQHFDEIMDAIMGRYQVRIRYFTASRQKEAYRRIEPYTLHYSDGGWYVIAKCRLRRRVLLFALHRIRELKPHPQKTFDVPPDYDADSYMGDAWRAFRGETIEVKLHFTAGVAQRVAERQWHATQTIHRGADGSLTMEVRVSGMEEIVRWVLGWGAGCRVLGPPELKERVAEEARALAQQYSEGEAGYG